MIIQSRHLRALATVALAAAPDVEKSPLSAMVQDTRTVASPLYYMSDDDLDVIAATINELISNRGVIAGVATPPTRPTGTRVESLRALARRASRRAVEPNPSPRDIRVLADGLGVALDAIADLLERR